MNINIGDKFRGWTVIGPAITEKIKKAYRVYYLCECSCGRRARQRKDILQAGTSKCCWYCKYNYRPSGGLYNTVEGLAWRNMIDRCYDQKTKSFRFHGARGIIVCNGWKSSLKQFVQDMGCKPARDMQLDRIDNAKGYYCGKCDQCKKNNWQFNCRWATVAQQCRNRRSNIMLTHAGKTMCLKDWADHLGIKHATLQLRIKKGWPPSIALTTPVVPGQKIMYWLKHSNQ